MLRGEKSPAVMLRSLSCAFCTQASKSALGFGPPPPPPPPQGVFGTEVALRAIAPGIARRSRVRKAFRLRLLIAALIAPGHEFLDFFRLKCALRRFLAARGRPPLYRTRRGRPHNRALETRSKSTYSSVAFVLGSAFRLFAAQFPPMAPVDIGEKGVGLGRRNRPGSGAGIASRQRLAVKLAAAGDDDFRRVHRSGRAGWPEPGPIRNHARHEDAPAGLPRYERSGRASRRRFRGPARAFRWT